jgi:hypothetical protein
MDASAALEHFIGATEFRRRVGAMGTNIAAEEQQGDNLLSGRAMGTRGRTESSDWNAFGQLWPPIVYGAGIGSLLLQ